MLRVAALLYSALCCRQVRQRIFFKAVMADDEAKLRALVASGERRSSPGYTAASLPRSLAR